MDHEREVFAERILEHSEVYDPEDIHHEFKDGGHGRKLDLEKIARGSVLYDELIIAQAADIKRIYASGLPRILIGIANGANHLAIDLAEAVSGDSGDIVGLPTKKNEQGKALLEYDERSLVREIGPKLVLIIDDLGTTGRSVRPVADQLKHHTMRVRRGFELFEPIDRVEAYFMWQRQLTLKHLKRSFRHHHAVPHNAFIDMELKTYANAKECRENPEGFCARDIKLIEHGK